MNYKKLLLPIVFSSVGSILGILLYVTFVPQRQEVITLQAKNEAPVKFASQNFGNGNLDFTAAAEMSVNAVVHVKIMANVTSGNSTYGNPFFDFFFGPQMMPPQQESGPQVVGAGSGVIISSDGYIVTNNHVVDGADQLEVILNDKRSFKAKLIGADPTTDIALIKIEGRDFPTLSFGNSDDIKVGEWVLAVGNPFNLTSTVTAGIVSAKSRSINIISNNSQPMGIESFIQTDAAVNPGNSGGALVNTRGELIGVNTAIASKTGSYSGYSFAVPSTIVRKVVSDLKEFGQVQRAMLGVQIRDINSELASKLNIDKLEGVYVEGVVEGGAASEGGVEKGDIILKVESEDVNSAPQLQEKIGKHRPGDKIEILIKRGDKLKLLKVVLRNVNGTSSIIKADEINLLLGADFVKPTDTELSSLRLSNGLKIQSLRDGKLKQNGVREGFIIVKANRVSVESIEDLKKVINSGEEGLFLTGVYPNGKVVYYAINLAD